MVGRVLRVLGACLAAACVASAAEAQPQATALPLEQLLGRTVTSVQIEVEGRREADATLLPLLEVRVGQPLRAEAVRESLAHLFNLGRFEDIVVSAYPDGAGVTVVVSVVPVHPIDRLELRGALGIDARTLERGILAQFGGRVSAVSSDAARAAVLQLLTDEGFARPTVETTLEQTHDVHRSTLVVTIDAGARLRVGRVNVQGASVLGQEAVTRDAGLVTGAPHRRRATEDALRVQAERLRGLRYYEASVSHFAAPAADDRVDVTVTVTPGPTVRIVLAGDPLPQGSVDDWVPIRRENSADDDLLEDAAFRIRRALQQEGFWRATAEARREVSADGREMTVTMAVTRGPRYRLAGVEVVGASHFSPADVRSMIALSPGAPFVEDQVDARLGALTSAYAFAGYAASIDVQYDAPIPATGGDGAVTVRVEIAEGPLRRVGAVVVDGTVAISEADVRRVLRLQPGQPLRDAQVREDRAAVLQLYLNRGYEQVEVAVSVSPEPDAVIRVAVSEGPQTIIDHVIIVGNQRVATTIILEALALKAGQPYGQAARLESQRRLSELAVFRRISITQRSGLRSDGHVDVVVQVEEAPATTIGYGGGIEVRRAVRSTEGGGLEDGLQFAPRGFLELGRRNLFGSSRSVTLFSRASLRPRSAPNDPARDGRGLTLSEYRVTANYRAPRALGLGADAVLGATVERAIRTSFTFERRGSNAELLKRFTDRTSLFGRYTLDSTRLFDVRIADEEQPLIDRLFPQIRLSTVSGGFVWDRRDDLLDPTSGGLISLDGELAARSIGSQVGFVKGFVQALGFRRITRANRVVLGGRVQLGLARGFEREVPVLDVNGNAVIGSSGAALTEVVRDLPAGRRFFTGGGNTVRGYQQDRLGVPGILNADGLSSGGNGLVVINGEVRTLLLPTVGLVGFVDAGNVFAKAGDLALGSLRGAAGVGVRYRSPLGPLRLDVGFKFDRRLVSGVRERGWEFHLSIGEVF
jgi:outer membrane protein assembly complex protein YaeT